MPMGDRASEQRILYVTRPTPRSVLRRVENWCSEEGMRRRTDKRDVQMIVNMIDSNGEMFIGSVLPQKSEKRCSPGIYWPQNLSGKAARC